ncbi:auxin-responsive protein IAA31 isoform X1 [Alnus glutinosa]|uniref:auxin-responsive protein IAA31 isoform X1 n=1 Tax=Alnus glutinosa TaxID=3517 RepID=UPI002D79EC8D|nr:auxin-responsive protein IAA31 isoform X1 [Alnus glutinosa]XP_062148002.1 auxin-responsive protein IAA31 isoform X1 [Alnus glutinosa]XP_062148756.1 auxin-responsive protein IAA31 isoform X1 [Alnus glutinosa]
MGRAAPSSSSSIDSSNHSSAASSSSSLSLSIESNSKSGGRLDLTTDLRLGLSISPSHYNEFSAGASPRYMQQPLNWPPIRSILRSAHAGKSHDLPEHPSLFIKIYMEGIPIGRKLNLFAEEGYEGLIRTIGHMFPTTFITDSSADRVHSDKYHVLTYEDKEGDWMMVGDVPWEMFLNNVKRLKVTRANRC